jgi:mRNA interferase YafQ
MISIETKPRFDRHYRKLSKQLKDTAKEKEPLFRENPFSPILRTHKLHGKENGVWAFWINYHYRIKFIFLSENCVLFLDIGPHDFYK